MDIGHKFYAKIAIAEVEELGLEAIMQQSERKLNHGTGGKMNNELELYKLIMTPDLDNEDFSYVSEMGWEKDMFLIWIPYGLLEDFMQNMTSIFGYGLFDDGAFDANMQSDGVCIDLAEVLGEYLDIEAVFPKDKFKH